MWKESADVRLRNWSVWWLPFWTLEWRVDRNGKLVVGHHAVSAITWPNSIKICNDTKSTESCVNMPSLSKSAKKCRITEIVQFTCETNKQPDGQVQNHCFPIPRIFRMLEISPYSQRHERSSSIVAQGDRLLRSRNWLTSTNEREK